MSAPPWRMALEELRPRIAGRVLAPGEDGYDEARTPFYGGFDRRPALVVRAAGAEDAARSIAFARETGLPFAVRAGGHSVAGHCVVDGGIVLDVSGMKGLEIDAGTRTATAEAGLTAAEFTAAAAEHGLALGFGDTGSVGIAGLTLGGGVGFLVRRFGLTIDHLLGAEVVTADGELVRTDAESHPDLFWAIRGGGGNFGVATRLTFRLEPVGSVVGGMLILPATADTVEGFVAAADAAPEELTTIANVMPAPPMPFLPEEHHGRTVIFALVCFAGGDEAGAKALAPLRALAEPLADLVKPIPYPEMYFPDEEGYHPMGVVRTSFVDRVDGEGARTIAEEVEASSAPMRVVQIRALGGAIERVSNDATAYAHRDRRFMVNVAALYEDPADRARHDAWVASLSTALQRGPAGAYANFLGEEGEGRVREAYPGATWGRLARLKARYDPDNLFRGNQNVPPDPEA